MYTETDLQKLIADVTTEFTAHLAKAEQGFNSAKPEDESKKKDESKASKDSGGEAKKPMETEKPEDKGVKDQGQQDMSKDPAKEDGKMESKEGRMQADSKENAKPSEDPHGEAMDHGYDDEDMQHMHSMYSSMSKGELKAHHDAVRKCMDGMAKSEMGDSAKDAEGYRPNGGSAHPEAASEKTPATSDMQAMNKSEKNYSMESDELKLLKSELEVAKAKSEESKKQLEAVSAFLTKFVEKTAPAGKAITSLDIIAKSSESQEKPLQKSEIDAKLMAKAKDFSLSKSDRDAINSYYCGSKNIEIVKHLLK